MKERIANIAEFLAEVDQLKLVTRASYVKDASRHENSAEHSWHLAFGLLVLARELDADIDVPRAVAMALVHDLCEIDAGDTPIYSHRPDQHEAEKRCIERLAASGLRIGPELRELWLEYEAQTTRESRWVKVMDRLLPFISNLSTQGRSWRERGIARSQVLRINEQVRTHAPEIHDWMRVRIDEAVSLGWLVDA